MKLLLILLSVMTWTVESKNAVSGDGEWPFDIDVLFENSYQKGDVRKGDEAVLLLANLGGMTVEAVEVYVKSNKTEGAGTFTVTGNGEQIAILSGTFKDWTGSYDNSDFHPIPLLSSPCDGIDELAISLVGTANSLHIEKYVIRYTQAPARTVTLMNGNEVHGTQTEPSGHQGVVLPSLSDRDQWQFIGWSETEFWTIHTMPPYHEPGTKFYPHEDCTLWAVYTFKTADTGFVTDMESGDYIYTNRNSNLVLTGIPDENGRMAYANLDIDDADQVYHIELAGPDTAFITHFATSTPIGWSGTKMAAKASPWLVYHEGEETIFYTVINNKKHVLWLNVWDTKEQVFYAGLQPTNDIEGSPMALRLPRQGADEPAFTCHPECGMGTETIHEDGQEHIVHFGIYELHIQNGHKRLIIR